MTGHFTSYKHRTNHELTTHRTQGLAKLRKMRILREEDPMREVPATEFTRNFGRYREIAQREPVAVTSHGRATGYFISAVEFEAMQRLKACARRSRAVVGLSQEEVQQITSGRMSPRIRPSQRIAEW